MWWDGTPTTVPEFVWTDKFWAAIVKQNWSKQIMIGILTATTSAQEEIMEMKNLAPDWYWSTINYFTCELKPHESMFCLL